MAGGRGPIRGVPDGAAFVLFAGLMVAGGLGVGLNDGVGLSVGAVVGLGLGLGVGVVGLTFAFMLVSKLPFILRLELKFELALKLKFESKPRFVFRFTF